MGLEQSSLMMVAVLAGILILSGWVHQIIKGYKTKSLKDVSTYLMSLIGVGSILWLLYGIEVQDIYIIGTNFTAMVFMVVIICMKRRYDKKSNIDSAV